MSDLAICVATCCWSGWQECMASWKKHADNVNRKYVIANTDVVSAYQECLSTSTEPFLAFIHDDVMIYEQGWDTRVLREFADPGVGVVGFGGALGHGASNLYTSPYHLPNLARQHFLSNMRSAERHGQRFTGERDVAILDGFALFVRRDIFDVATGSQRLKFSGHNCRIMEDLWEPCRCQGYHCRVCGQRWYNDSGWPNPIWKKSEGWRRCSIEGDGGWPGGKSATYFMYSEWLCCEARRQGYRIRLVGVDCEHLGGRSSGFIPSDENYEEAHRYFFENNRDVMPYKVKE